MNAAFIRRVHRHSLATMQPPFTDDGASDNTDVVEVLHRRIQGLELKNRILRAQLSQMRLTSDNNHRLVDAYRSEEGRRNQRLGELLVKYLSGKR